MLQDWAFYGAHTDVHGERPKYSLCEDTKWLGAQGLSLGWTVAPSCKIACQNSMKNVKGQCAIMVEEAKARAVEGKSKKRAGRIHQNLCSRANLRTTANRRSALNSTTATPRVVKGPAPAVESLSCTIKRLQAADSCAWSARNAATEQCKRSAALLGRRHPAVASHGADRRATGQWASGLGCCSESGSKPSHRLAPARQLQRLAPCPVCR